MFIEEAARILQGTLEVDENRYPFLTAIQHINEAMLLFARMYETRLSEHEGYVQLNAEQEGFNLSSLSTVYTYPVTAERVRALFYCTDFSSAINEPNPSNRAQSDWIRLFPAPVYDDLLQKYNSIEPGEPLAWASMNNTIKIRPVTEDAIFVRVIFDAVPQYLGTGENLWMNTAPYACIYQAAQIACVWLEDEQRVPVYEKLFSMHIESINVMDAGRADGPISMSEV
ncbi:MAG TPA: hypothetical protein VMW79_07855 [Anaerolineae bacterium]|nr:hypothetical protein [Anaerolineae bacterium]